MKFHIDEISYLARSNTSFIKKLDITGEKIVILRFFYIPVGIWLKYKMFNNGVIEFEIAGNRIKRGLVRASIGLILKKGGRGISRLLSISGDIVFVRINDFFKNEIADVKGLQLSRFDIIGKEVVVLFDNKEKRKK